MMRRPPDLRRQFVTRRSEGLYGCGKQQRLADRRDLRLQTLLARLRPERREVRRDHVAGDDVGSRALERADMGGEVVRQRLKAARVEEPEAVLAQLGRQGF